MTNQETLASKLGSLADGVRGVVGSSDSMTIDQMTAALTSYTPSGGFDWTQCDYMPRFANRLPSNCNFDASGIKVYKASDGSTSNTPFGFTSSDSSSHQQRLITFDGTGMDLTECTSLSFMFPYCKAFTTADFGTIDAPVLTSLSNMFEGCTALTSVDLYIDDTTHANADINMTKMFYNCQSLPSSGIHVDFSKASNLYYTFYNCDALTSTDFLTQSDLSGVTSLSYAFSSCGGLTTADFSDANLSQVSTLGYMFNGCNALTSVDFTGSNLGSVVRNTRSMFNGCTSLTTISGLGDLTPFPGAENGDEFMETFKNCSSLTSLDARAWSKRRKGDGRTYSSVGYDFCSGCTALESACFIDAYQLGNSNVFKNCSSLECLIWLIKDNNYNTATATGTSDPFAGSAIAAGTGYVYINDSKVDTFKAASSTVWSTYASQIKPISECPQKYLTLYNIDPQDYQ